MTIRRSSRNHRRITRSNQGLTAKLFRERKISRQPTATLVTMQPDGPRNVTVRGRDIEKMLLRNEAMGEAGRGDYTKLVRFNRRYKSFSVKDIKTGEDVNLIMSPSDLHQAKDKMTEPQRIALDKRYAEDMSEAA